MTEYEIAWRQWRVRIKQRVDAKKAGTYWNERWLRDARERVEALGETILATKPHANTR